jgi:hypothetical protein
MWQSSNHYTHYTPNSAVRIQKFLERKAVFDPTSSTGFRKWDPSTQRMEEFKNIVQKNDGEEEKVPKLYRVPVTTIVGYYDPHTDRGLKPYVYPAMHGSYGFVYDADGDSFPLTSDDNTANDSCELVVETINSGVQVFKLSTTIHNAMNKFHVNVATVDEPYEAKVYCRNELQAQRALELPREPLKYTVTGVPFDDDSNNNEDINTIQMFKVDVPSPSDAPSAVPSSIPSEMPTTSMEPTSYPTSFPTTTNPPTTISEEEEENACKDSVESFQWNQKKHANCAWLRTVSSGVLNKQCNKKKQDRRVFDWCPVTCGKCLPPSAE